MRFKVRVPATEYIMAANLAPVSLSEPNESWRPMTDTVQCRRAVEHGAYGAGSESSKHGIVHEAALVNGASVDDVAAQSCDLCFGFSPPLAKFVRALRRPMFELQFYFSVIVERKPVFQLSSVVGRKAVFRSPRTQFGEHVKKAPPGGVSAFGVAVLLISTPKRKEPVEGFLGRQGRIQGRGDGAWMVGDQVVRQVIVIVQFNFGEHFKADQLGGAGKVAKLHRCYEYESPFGRDAEWIAPQFKRCIVTSECRLKSAEFVTESLSLAAATSTAGPRGLRRSTAYTARTGLFMPLALDSRQLHSGREVTPGSVPAPLTTTGIPKCSSVAARDAHNALEMILGNHDRCDGNHNFQPVL